MDIILGILHERFTDAIRVEDFDTMDDIIEYLHGKGHAELAGVYKTQRDYLKKKM